jgi:hypothetical protein
VYVLENLGVGVPQDSFSWQTIQQTREQVYASLLKLAWDPSGAKRRLLSLQWARLPPQVKNNILAGLAQSQQVVQIKLLALQQAALNRLLTAQFEALAREQARQNEMLTRMLGDLLREDAQVIAAKLKDEQPLTRWAAAMVAGRKRLHLEAELIDLLGDRYPQVRQAAREALARLSRGNDFGPLPKATAQQIAQSVQAWRQWLALQDPPERIPEYIARPQSAESADLAAHAREALPPPQLAQAEESQP